MKSIIKSFSIEKLFGANNVSISFEDTTKILIGENGLGKTQVLSLLYYVLSRNFFRLNEFDFESLKLEFYENSITITKNDVNQLSDRVLTHPYVKEFISEVGYNQFEIARNKFIHYDGNLNILEREFENRPRSKTYLYHKLFRVLDDLEIHRKNLFNNEFDQISDIIVQGLGLNEIMYFPTYRRVEEDLHVLGYDENLEFGENNLIQFGMNDVQRRFDFIEMSIDKLLKEGLAQFTKDILNVVIDDSEPKDSISVLEKINEEDIDIILSRVGNQLPQQQKEAVKSIVANKQIKNPLSAYLLQKLVDIYEKQKELDNAVKLFRDVCNSYLINKEVFYDESRIKIFIKSNITDGEIKLSKLSSGEKQIISIFSKLYLSNNDKRFVVLFDEPELSLSILWQKKLLSDIIKSNKCTFLLAVTHSPFIFDNELDRFAVGLNEYIISSSNFIFDR